jgi:hypothetical protein
MQDAGCKFEAQQAIGKWQLATGNWQILCKVEEPFEIEEHLIAKTFKNYRGRNGNKY